MTQTGGLVILYAWLIFAGLLAVLAYLLLRHEHDPLQDLNLPGQDDQDETKPLPAPTVNVSLAGSRPVKCGPPDPGIHGPRFPVAARYRSTDVGRPSWPAAREPAEQTANEAAQSGNNEEQRG